MKVWCKERQTKFRTFESEKVVQRMRSVKECQSHERVLRQLRASKRFDKSFVIITFHGRKKGPCQRARHSHLDMGFSSSIPTRSLLNRTRISFKCMLVVVLTKYDFVRLMNDFDNQSTPKSSFSIHFSQRISFTS